MMKTYAVRKKLRNPVYCQLCYFSDGTLSNGIVWDLSETGWRATGERTVPVGTESAVYITLRDGKQSHNILIDAAVVRWSDGQAAGWEITQMDEASRARLIDFIDRLKLEDRSPERMISTRW